MADVKLAKSGVRERSQAIGPTSVVRLNHENNNHMSLILVLGKNERELKLYSFSRVCRHV
jgi:tartrate dehydratase beta subunit/fumarate hydratase class I family protein